MPKLFALFTRFFMPLMPMFFMVFLPTLVLAQSSVVTELPLPKPKAQPVMQASPEEKPKSQWTIHHIKIKPNGSLSQALDRLDISQKVVYEINHLKNSRYLTQLNAGDHLKVWLDKDNQLQRILYPKSQQVSYELTHQNNHFKISKQVKNIQIRPVLAAGTIEGSFYLSSQKAGLSAKTIMNLAKIYNWEIDFIRQLRAGDAFKVIYEKKYIHGKYIGDGNILAAEIITDHGHKTHKAFLLQNKKGEYIGYFDEKGHNLKKAFLRNPVNFVHITSRYSPRRFHPVLKKWKAHRGVDYGGKVGTPIHVTGNGRIIKRYRSKSYGNVIFVKHAGIYTTVYAHMSRFAHNHVGQYVKQGQVIGYIGQTGWATGPHLHYEFRIHNHFRDPLKVHFPNARPVPKKYRTVFKHKERILNAQLDRISTKNLLVLRHFE